MMFPEFEEIRLKEKLHECAGDVQRCVQYLLNIEHIESSYMLTGGGNHVCTCCGGDKQPSTVSQGILIREIAGMALLVRAVDFCMK